MKKIFCELHMFDADQKIFIMDTETNELEYVSTASMVELPEIISATCDNKNLDAVLLMGNSVYCTAVAEDIIAFSKIHYKKNNLEVEVLKQ